MATAGVCIKHFDERFVTHEDRIKRDDGATLVVPEKENNLYDGFYPPTVNKHILVNLNERLPLKRKKKPHGLWGKKKKQTINSLSNGTTATLQHLLKIL